MTKFAKQMLLTHLRYALEMAEASAVSSQPLVDIRGDLAALIVQVEECDVVDFSQPPIQKTLQEVHCG